jgi:thioesterase domain-containing protein
MKKIIFILASILVLGCKDNSVAPFSLKENSFQLADHSITYYHTHLQKDKLVVFESGLGDGGSIWKEKNILKEISKQADVLIYDRAGYGKSTKSNSARNIQTLSAELKEVIAKVANQRKVILVGHSLGGMIVRDYAIQNPSQVASILFVDPSHELYNDPTQEEEDEIYTVFKNAYGLDFGGTMEAKELIEDTAYMKTLLNLPNIPVIVLTSMKTNSSQNAADRQQWSNAHKELKNGVTDFTQLETTESGHYIQIDKPQMVIENLQILLNK